MNRKDLVSVIMPAYNAAQYIETAIGSVLNQTYQNIELIIINDGSQDNTASVIRQYTADPRVIYIEQNNRGVSAARNKGLEQMRGGYFCFLDADDRYPKDSIQLRLEEFGKNKRVAFVDGAIEIMDIDLEKVLEVRRQTFSGMPLNALLSLDPSCFFGLSWMIKRKEGVRYKFKSSLTHGEDLLFYISIADQGEYRALDHVILHYRKGHQSAMANLKGLESGYFEIHKALSDSKKFQKKVTNKLKKKIKSIMFKSYLSKFRLISAVKVIFR